MAAMTGRSDTHGRGLDAAGKRAGALEARLTGALSDTASRTGVALVEAEPALARAATAALARGLEAGASMKDIVAGLLEHLARTACNEALSLPLTILRFSANGAWLESLAAGAPPVLILRPDGRRLIRAAGGPMTDDARPYAVSLTPLPPGSIVLAATASLAGGDTAEAMEGLAEALELARRPPPRASSGGGPLLVETRSTPRGAAFIAWTGG